MRARHRLRVGKPYPALPCVGGSVSGGAGRLSVRPDVQISVRRGTREAESRPHTVGEEAIELPTVRITETQQVGQAERPRSGG